MSGDNFLRPEWFDLPAVRKAFTLYADAGIPLCFIGGAVRDAVLGKPPVDLDAIVGCLPEQSYALLIQAGITFENVPSNYRLCRAQVDEYSFDFLHPQVVFPNLPFDEMLTRCAQRTDFTINAIQLHATGQLHDPCGGKEDLLAGRIRFTGEPYAMLKAEVHRPLPLRFFRLLAWFGKTEPPSEGLNASIEHAPVMAQNVPAYILRKEAQQLLSAPTLSKTLTLMQKNDVLKHVFGFTVDDVELIARLEAAEQLAGSPSSWEVRLALLLISTEDEREAFARLMDFWKMDAKEGKALDMILDYYSSIELPMPDWEMVDLVKRCGAKTIADLLMVCWALEENPKEAAEKYRQALAKL